MSIQMTKGRKIAFLLALFLTNTVMMADLLLVPVFPNFYMDFGNQINLVNYIVSGPMLICVLSSLLTATLMKWFSKKTLLSVALIIFGLSAVLCIAIYNIYFIAAMRSLMGFATGLVWVSSVALIAEVFTDEKQRGTIMGMNNGAGSAIGIILSLVAGAVAAQHWQSVFLIYLITVPILILAMIFLPNTGKEVAVSANGENSAKKEKINRITFISLCVSYFIFSAIYYIVSYLIGVYVIENSIGNETISGLLASVGTVGSLVTCVLFGLVYGKFKRGTVIPSFALLGIGYFFLYLVPSVPMSIVMCILMGAAYGNGMSYFILRSTLIVPPAKVSTVISIITAISGIGGFAATYLSTALQSISGSSTITGIMPFLAIICAVGTILSIILTVRNTNYPSEYKVPNTVSA